jgi:hypothetical protein
LYGYAVARSRLCQVNRDFRGSAAHEVGRAQRYVGYSETAGKRSGGTSTRGGNGPGEIAGVYYSRARAAARQSEEGSRQYNPRYIPVFMKHHDFRPSMLRIEKDEPGPDSHIARHRQQTQKCIDRFPMPVTDRSVIPGGRTATAFPPIATELPRFKFPFTPPSDAVNFAVSLTVLQPVCLWLLNFCLVISSTVMPCSLTPLPIKLTPIRHESPNISETRSICWKIAKR